jgi:hypothetical protein
VDDPAYICEKNREIEAQICDCLCSNCARSEAAILLDNLVFANQDNFDNIIGDKFQTTETRDIRLKYPSKPSLFRKRKIPDSDRPVLEAFKIQLIADLHNYYQLTFGSEGPLAPADIFGDEEAESIISYSHHINNTNDVRTVIGGECFEGQLNWLLDQITIFKTSRKGNDHPISHKKRRAVSGSAAITSLPSQPSVGLSRNRCASATSAPRPPSKKVLAAEARRQKLIEKKAQDALWLLSEQKRKEQVATIPREGLEKAHKEKEGTTKDA